MKRVMRCLAVLALVVGLVPAVIAADTVVPVEARRVVRAAIEPMRSDLGGTFMVWLTFADSAIACPLTKDWSVEVTTIPEVDGTFARMGVGQETKYCDIFVHNADTKMAWERMLAPYRPGYTAVLPIDPSSKVQIQIKDIVYIASEHVVAVDGSAPVNITQGDEFRIDFKASVSGEVGSPCGDHAGRPCHLELHLQKPLPDGSRKSLVGGLQYEWGTVFVPSDGGAVPVSVRGRISRWADKLPRGKAVIVGEWFLSKNYASMADYQIPLGSFEIPVNIR